ncbi:uncharacterized protein G2W53_006054 [Senna tora]|uniref:Retrotransposon gag domain-containing protein n=1 Tax=Senna tora TaxID=362788 RepID=A0A835CG47_9FABA|nr:uncharacterized protein G2W53_006054 [Senna tora]
MDEKSLIKKYRREIHDLKQELQQLKHGIMENFNVAVSSQEDLVNLKLQLEAGRSILQSRLEEEEQAKASLMGRIQQLTKLILVSTKTVMSSSISESSGKTHTMHCMPRGKKKKRVVEASPPPVRGRKRRGRAISHSPVRSPISPSSPESIHSEEAEMAEQNNRNVSDYATTKLDGLQHSIRRPSIQANNFEIKPATIQLLQANGQFGGSPIEDPNNHILNFLEICDTFKHNGVSDDAIRLRLFPFSLRDKAKVWLQSLPEGSITTWEELAQQFLTKYFPPGKTAKMRNDITSFVLLDNESLYEAWERFKELLRKCPHHGLPKWLQVQTFYNGLSSEIRTSIDAAAGGALMSKPVDAAYTLLETMSSNNHQWHSDRHVHARVAGVQDSDMFPSLSSQIAALTKEVKSLGIQGAVKAVSPIVQACENCGEMHTSEQCPLVLESV